jgi:hypothetical protein
LTQRVQMVLKSFGDMEAAVVAASDLMAEQESGVNQISSAMRQVDNSAQATSAHAEELSASSEHLSSLARTVSEALDALKVVTGRQAEASSEEVASPASRSAPDARRAEAKRPDFAEVG